MAFTTKSWQNWPTTTTPLNAAALVDMETRLSAYTDARVPVFDPRQFGAVMDADIYGNGGTDDTAAVQAAIDAASATDGGIVILPGMFQALNVVHKKNVLIQGASRACGLIAPASAASGSAVIRATETDIAGNEDDAPHHTGLINLRIDGNARSGSQADCARYISGASDAYYTIAGHTLAGDVDSFNDAGPLVHGCQLMDAGRIGLWIGRNMRGTLVSDCMIQWARTYGAYCHTTDSRWSNTQIGSCGDSLWVDNASNAFTGCKFWYSIGTAAVDNIFIFGRPYAGTGHGAIISGHHNHFTGCETQDNAGYGWYLESVHSTKISGCVAGGDREASIALRAAIGDCEYNDVDVQVRWADRYQTKRLLLLHGSTTANNNNTVRIAEHPDNTGIGNRDGAWVEQVTLDAGASLAVNDVYGPAFNRNHGTYTKGVVNHGAASNVARPTGYVSVEWVGSVEPTNAINGDTWVNTT